MSQNKSIDELKLLETTQLKAILTGLDIAVPELDFRKQENKDKLVHLVYDTQQPDPDAEQNEEELQAEKEAEKERAEERGKESRLDVDALLQEIAEFFGGTIAEDGQTEDETVVFVVNAEAGNELARGTFLELREKVEEAKRSALEDEQRQDELDAQAEAEANQVMPELEDSTLSELEQELSGLKSLGLKYEISEHVIKLRFGAKIVTTTLHQPNHVIRKTAEMLIK